MNKILTALVVSASLVMVQNINLSANALNCSEKLDDRGVISVSYTAEKEVSPDTVEVSIAVKTFDKVSMNNATKQNKEISDKIYSYLKGVIKTENNDFIKTANYSARPIYVYQDRKQVFDKYEVSNNIIVRTKSIDKIAAMIDKSISLGATNIDSLNFSLSKKDSVCDELLKNATVQTVSRANVVANSAGTSVVGVKSIGTSCSLNQNQSINYARNSLMMAKSMDSISSEGASSPIEAGIIKVYSTVNGTFFIK